MESQEICNIPEMHIRNELTIKEQEPRPDDMNGNKQVSRTYLNFHINFKAVAKYT